MSLFQPIMNMLILVLGIGGVFVIRENTYLIIVPLIMEGVINITIQSKILSLIVST